MRLRVLGAVVALAAAFSAFAETGNPVEALNKISVIRSTRPTSGEEAAKQQKEVAAIAEEALKDVDLAKIAPADGLNYARLLLIVRKYEAIPGVVDSYLTTNPTGADLQTALTQGVIGAVYSDQLEKGIAYADRLPSSTDQEKLSRASMYFNYFDGSDLAKLKGVQPAIAFVLDLMRTLPTTTDEKQAPMISSINASGYEVLADLYMANGEKAKALGALTDGQAKISDQRFKSGLASKEAQLKAIGTDAPELVVNRKIGDFKDLASLKGKVVILDFFAHWCGPCKASFGDLRKLNADLKDKGVQIVHATRFYKYYGAEKNLTEDQEYDKMVGFSAENKFDWPVVFVDNATYKAYGVSGIPHVVLIGADGKIQRFKIGYSEQSFVEFRKKVEELVAAAKAAK